MGRVTRSSSAVTTDKENTPQLERKTRIRSKMTPLAAVTPRKALGDINRNVIATPRLLTPGKKAVKRKGSERSVTESKSKVACPPAPQPAGNLSVGTPPPEQSDCPPNASVRPPSCQQLSQEKWECLQMTAGPDHVAFWWRAAEERREALKELIEENIQVHQQNHLLKQELVRLQVKESEASYFGLMARLWQLESDVVNA